MRAKDSMEINLPHTPPMLMVWQILDVTDTYIHTNSKIDKQNPFVRNGVLPCMAGLELLAQTGGLLYGMRNVKPGSNSSPTVSAPLAGAVVRLQSFQLGAVKVPVGAVLYCTAEYIGGGQQAIMLNGRVNYNDQTVFTGTLMIAMFKEQSL